MPTELEELLPALLTAVRRKVKQASHEIGSIAAHGGSSDPFDFLSPAVRTGRREDQDHPHDFPLDVREESALPSPAHKMVMALAATVGSKRGEAEPFRDTHVTIPKDPGRLALGTPHRSHM